MTVISSLRISAGQATFLGYKRRDIVNKAFRGLALPYNLNLWICLPAEARCELV